MGLAVKEMYDKRTSVSKKEFEKAYVELMENVRMIDQKLSTKADEVVLTMALSHRQEIEDLQTEVFHLRTEIKQLKKQEQQRVQGQISFGGKQNTTFINWIKKLQLSRK